MTIRCSLAAVVALSGAALLTAVPLVSSSNDIDDAPAGINSGGGEDSAVLRHRRTADEQVPPSHTLNEIKCHLIESEVDTPGVSGGGDGENPNANWGGYTEYLCVPPASDENGVAGIAYAIDVDPAFIKENG
eukprot:CAMPEP_0197441196 /NCGR_PEP_ID=MMETSP1175-20131217/7527_1 /TAXON_ID=1003142 /ORGANISM="Triceratium dubium, Strain CCMP147" /LENGTH=131 /DNA_ID=CAMNT_0042971441 /DNA_START=286 /DNA_END=677 /DNA_ORIENTATION=+